MQYQEGSRSHTTAWSCGSFGITCLVVWLLVSMTGAWGTALAESEESATYRWAGELVGLDETDRALTVRARLLTDGALAAVETLETGVPIVITWSGYGDQAYGIRAVTRARDAETDDDDRYRLPATFVQADSVQQYLTFIVRPPADSLAMVRALRRGDWASFTSPHRPSGATAAVTTIATYISARQVELAPLGTYDWAAELVALDESERTLTVTARFVTIEARTALDGLEAGAPILITWSGLTDRAAGIRAVRRHDGSGLWGGDRFLLPATFVTTDPARQYLTFTVTPPADGLATARALRRGDWATLTSPHQPTGTADAVTTVAAFSPTLRPLGPAPSGSYDWAAELVALDESNHTLTVTARLVTVEARTALDGLEAGAPILITWSGLTDRAAGIRAVRRHDGSGLWGGDRFLLPATFVTTDPARQYLTFTVTPPADGLATARALRRGDWATLTSPHQPTGTADAVTTVAAFSPTLRPLGPAPSGSYDWAAELVALDESNHTLTVTARLVTVEARTALDGLEAGAPILITWSGLTDRAAGIRAVRRYDGSGLWGGDRFLLPATFVTTDPARQYLTFTVTPPADGLATARALRRSDWATLTSPHRPAGTADAVTTVVAYNPALRPLGPPPSGTYDWVGELVAFDESARTLTVRSRLVTEEAQAAVEGLEAGAPIIITWSGLTDRTDGIRSIAHDDDSGLWGGDRFLLPAIFVTTDQARRYLTFTVTPPADGLAAARALRRGDWATVTSPHRPSGVVDAVTTVAAYSPATPAPMRTYQWAGELVALDLARMEVSVSAPVEEHVFRYVDRFSEGDEVVLIWTPADTGEATAIRYLELRDQSKLDHGYVLPVEFLSADSTQRRITFKTTVLPETVNAPDTLRPGSWIRVTSAFEQDGETAAIVTVEEVAE